MSHTLARGARQFVVQLALETMLISEVYLSSLTPTTNMGASLLGAEITTFLAPPYIIIKKKENTAVRNIQINREIYKAQGDLTSKAAKYREYMGLLDPSHNTKSSCLSISRFSIKTPVTLIITTKLTLGA